MADEKTPAQKARERVEMEIEAMRLRATDPAYRALTKQTATLVQADRHAAIMHDFGTGAATERAIVTYKVRRAVSDFAMGEGRKANGDALDAPKLPTADVAPIAGKAPEGKTATVKA